MSFLHAAWYIWYLDQESTGIGMRHHVVECSRVNQHIFSIEGEREAIQASRSRSIQVFPVNMIVGTVAGAFETHTVVAKRYATAQVNAALVQRDPI